MIVEAETVTFAGLITRPGRSEPYRFEFIASQNGEELFLFRRPNDRAEWQLLNSSHGQAERDFLWQRYSHKAVTIVPQSNRRAKHDQS